MSIVKETGKITFSYTYEEVFDVVQMVTNEIAVSILTPEGMPMLDEYGVSEDEHYTVKQKMKDGSSEVFEKSLMKITHGIVDSVVLTDESVSCAIMDKQAYNENILTAIDRLIKQAIINYIIKDWFIDKRVEGHAEIYATKYVKNVTDIVKRSVQLRKSAIV